MQDKIKLLHQERHWSEVVLLTQEIYEGLGEPSIRILADEIGKSKSWVDKSLQLAKGLKVWPYLIKEETRHSAYLFIQKRKKQQRSIK